MRKNIFQVIMAAAAAVVISLVFVLAFTLNNPAFLAFHSGGQTVNQVFKIISIAAGGLIFIRGDKGLVKGLIHGLIAVIIRIY